MIAPGPGATRSCSHGTAASARLRRPSRQGRDELLRLLDQLGELPRRAPRACGSRSLDERCARALASRLAG